MLDSIFWVWQPSYYVGKHHCLGMIRNDCIYISSRISLSGSDVNWTLLGVYGLLAALLAHVVGVRGPHVGGLGVGPDHVALRRVAHLLLRYDPVDFS